MAELPGIWTYHGITLEQIEALAAKLGQPLAGSQLTTGRVKTHDVQIGWNYDPLTQTLVVTAYNETWLASYARIKANVDEKLGVVGQ